MPLSPSTPPTPGRPAFERPSPWPPAILLLVFVLAAAAIGGMDYLRQRRALEQQARDNLGAIADLKARQITSWLDERRSDAELLLRISAIPAEARRWLETGADAARLSEHLCDFQAGKGYRAVLLFDRQVRVRLATGGAATAGEADRALARRAMAEGRVLLSDLHFEPDGRDRIGLDIAVPLYEGARQPVGVLYLGIDARRHFYPLVQAWPTASPSAETLLARRDGDDVLYLNELRHRKETALALRFPIGTPDLPAAMAVRGREGVVEGVDYRGVRQLAALRAVPGTGWHLIAKVDKAEVLAPLAERVRLAAALVVLLFFVVVLALASWWWRQRSRLEAAYAGALARLNAELEGRVAERTARLQAMNAELEAFSASVAHDLRAPLRAIEGFAGIVAQRHRAALNAEAQHYFDNIVDAAGAMDHMIADLLRYARLGGQATPSGRVSLPDLMDQLEREFGERAAQAGVTLILPATVPEVAVERTLMEQVLANLIANGLTYRRPGAASWVRVTCEQGGGRLRIAVADNGIGIAPEHHDKIFQLFQRLHAEDEYPGSGLGLALVRKAAGLMGGRVWVESAPDEGSTFHVEIAMNPLA